MKSILALNLIVAFVAAEVPSNSYLPPPPYQGYPKASTPSIVAARALEGEHNGEHHNGLHRNREHHNAELRNGEHHNIDHHGSTSANGFARSGSHDQSAAYGVHQSTYSSDEGYDSNAAFRNAVDDVNTTVSYEAEERGYKSQASYEDTEDGRSGYDNSNKFRANIDYHGNEQDGAHGNAHANSYN